MAGNWTSIEVGLVLQGGGALGAYEWGAIEALFEVMGEAGKSGPPIALRVVTGASIGAINAACIVGAADPADSIKRLGALWNELILETPLFWPPQAARDLSLYGLPSFYAPRPDLLTLPSWTYVYDTHPLIDTLKKHIDFAALNKRETAFVITAVDVESGKLQRFANQQIGETKPITIAPEHVLASGSLPPQFPWTDIPAETGLMHCWDGGIVDNTPLGDAIDAFSRDRSVYRLLVVMNLFPDKARLPESLPEVTERVDQLRFGNRLHQDASIAIRINELASAVDELAGLVTVELRKELADKVADARRYKLVTPVEIALLPERSDADDYGFRDFSRAGVERRRRKGHDIALAKLGAAFATIPAPAGTAAP
jgi:predicted acylesterase/phospholipase RssA